MERLGALQRRPERADDRDFKPVKDPRDAQSDHHEQVKATPRQPVKAKRNAGPDHGQGLQCLHRPKHLLFVGSGSGLRWTTDLVTRLKGGRSMCSMKQLDKALSDHIVDFGALFLAVARLAAIFDG